MKKTLYFIFTFCALILTSCSGYPFRDTTAYHYVAAYYPVDSFYVVEYRNSFDYVTKETSIYLGMIGDFDGGTEYSHQEDVYSDYYENSTYKPTQEQYDKYMELCEKHRDYEYKHKIEILPFKDKEGNGCGYVKGYTYWDITPVSIDIASNADFDETHPAGTSLNDITLFTTFSPYPFIKNGYTGKEFVKNKKTLDKYTQDDFKLVFCLDDVSTFSEDLDRDNYGALTFAKEPTKSKEHTFTVTIKDDYGRTFTDSLTMTFK